jgi:hypothetical protein
VILGAKVSTIMGIIGYILSKFKVLAPKIFR